MILPCCSFRHFCSSICCILITLDICSSLWWSMGHREPQLVHNRLCRRIKKLKGPQRNICRRDKPLMQQILLGSQLALRQCENQFQNQRWNCTQHKKSLKRILKEDNKESAVLNAFVSAGIVHAVTQSCDSGKLVNCSCGRSRKKQGKNKRKSHKKKQREGNSRPTKSLLDAIHTKKIPKITNIFRHSSDNNQISLHRRQLSRIKLDNMNRKQLTSRNKKGTECTDNVAYGYRIARKFTDWRFRQVKEQRDVRTLVMLHNNEAGRLIVLKNLQKRCKCHGLSGSCSTRTCSKVVPSIRLIGQKIYEKYLRAVKVTSTNDGRGLTSSNLRKKVAKYEFVYLEKSPNYCKRNIQKGSLGTRGRECNATLSSGSGSCDSLCCGRGFISQIHHEMQRCGCQLVVPCYDVTCKECLVTEQKHYCH